MSVSHLHAATEQKVVESDEKNVVSDEATPEAPSSDDPIAVSLTV
jgi:hypothetical protein